MVEYTSHRINLSTPNSRIELFMNDECVGQVDIELKAKVTLYKPHISNKRPRTKISSPQPSPPSRKQQKLIDLSRGVLELEMEELLWNRKMLMDHMGYKNYRDIDNFIKTLIKHKHLKSVKEGKVEWYRSTGSGNIWLNNAGVVL